MSPPHWAYHVDNFDPPPDDELVCSVCRGVFCDPVQTPCNHVYCKGCLLMWLQKKQDCPICRKHVVESSVQDVVPLVKNMIMKLTLRCCNWDNNCREKLSVETCEGHLLTCPYEMVQCTNRSCEEMMLRKDLKEHRLNSCKYQAIRCSKCYLTVKLRQKKHNCITALRRKLLEQGRGLKKKDNMIRKLEADVQTLKDNRKNSTELFMLAFHGQPIPASAITEQSASESTMGNRAPSDSTVRDREPFGATAGESSTVRDRTDFSDSFPSASSSLRERQAPYYSSSIVASRLAERNERYRLARDKDLVTTDDTVRRILGMSEDGDGYYDVDIFHNRPTPPSEGQDEAPTIGTFVFDCGTSNERGTEFSHYLFSPQYPTQFSSTMH